MLREFRDFIMRGNVIDLAVGIVIGAAFSAVITSFVTNVLTPLTGIFGAPNFEALQMRVGSATVHYGLFLNALLSFVLIAAALFFVVVKPMNAIERRRQAREDQPQPTTKTCSECASSIPRTARRCPFCTQPQS
ncbi:MAG: large conductance mechanosensitive channel protein MscL [Chloroflexota bacterium]|nr:large conductance mechanosensitive channel protein MscL [Chloroflexota bacterium]